MCIYDVLWNRLTRKSVLDGDGLYDRCLSRTERRSRCRVGLVVSKEGLMIVDFTERLIRLCPSPLYHLLSDVLQFVNKTPLGDSWR